jgi:hypothetical protein
MGELRDMVFEPHAVFRPIYAEEWAVNVDAVYCGERPIFRGVLRYPDADAMANIPAAGAFSFARNQSTTYPGSTMGARGGVLIFTPIYSGHPAVKLYFAIPMIDDAAQLQLSMGEEWGLAVSFMGCPDSSGKVYAVGPIGSLP